MLKIFGIITSKKDRSEALWQRQVRESAREKNGCAPLAGRKKYASFPQADLSRANAPVKTAISPIRGWLIGLFEILKDGEIMGLGKLMDEKEQEKPENEEENKQKDG